MCLTCSARLWWRSFHDFIWVLVTVPWWRKRCTCIPCQHRHMYTHTGVSGIYSNLSRLWNAVLECQAQPIAWFLPICITASLSHLPFSLLSCVKSGTTVWHITRHELAGYGVGEEIAEYFQENGRTKSLCYTIAPPPITKGLYICSEKLEKCRKSTKDNTVFHNPIARCIFSWYFWVLLKSFFYECIYF